MIEFLFLDKPNVLFIWLSSYISHMTVVLLPPKVQRIAVVDVLFSAILTDPNLLTWLKYGNHFVFFFQLYILPFTQDILDFQLECVFCVILHYKRIYNFSF